MNKIAVIDLGSNSVRMLIMKVNPDGSYKMIEQVKEMVRLSEGMGDDKTLKDEPIKRTIKTLCLFNRLIQVHNVKTVIPVATAATRQAKNKEYFLKRVLEETGLNFRVLTGKYEAYYDYLGVINTIDADNYVLIDIGGASTEIGYVKNRKLIKKDSIPIGAVNITEKFFSNGSITKNSVGKALNYIDNCFSKVNWIKEIKCNTIIGLGGTIRTLAKINKKDIDFPVKLLHNYHLSSNKVNKYIENIIYLSVDERKDISGLNKSRADIIGGGLLPLKYLFNLLSPDNLIVSGNGLREGIFFEEYFKTFKRDNFITWNVLEHSINNIMRCYETNINHNNHVKNLTLKLFDQLYSLHKLDFEKRKILEVSALLHDIGMYIDYYNHHKHTFYLILNSRIFGLNYRQLVMCAFISSMHRPQHQLKEDWREYSQIISQDDYDDVKILRVFLMIAEKLDRSEYGIVEDITCNIEDDFVTIYVKTLNSADLEIAAALKSSRAFYKQFNKILNIVSINC